MKLLLLSLLAGLALAQDPQQPTAGSAATNSDFTRFLNEITTHASFHRLPEAEKLLFAELVMEAETGAADLKAFVDRVGLLSVIKLVDHLSDTDAHKFSQFLAEAMNYHTTSSHYQHLQDWLHNRPHIGKRDSEGDHSHHWSTFYNLIYQFEHDGYFRHLGAAERHTLDGLTQAVGHLHVQEFIDTVGYGDIFGLLNECHTLNGLTWAVGHMNVQQFIDTAGYGDIFGLLNALDPHHAHEMYTFLEIILAQSA